MSSEIIKYQGFVAKVEVDIDLGMLCGTVINSAPHTFYGETIKDLEREFAVTIDEYLKVCKEKGQEPRKLYSGKLQLRLPPELHSEVAIKAAQSGESINSWITHTVEHALHN